MGKQRNPNTSLQKEEELFGPDPLTEALRGKIREMIMTLVEAEISEVLIAASYERTAERKGYRNGSKSRMLSTGFGVTKLTIPRARLKQGEKDVEWCSHLLPRYQRRAASVDAALLGAYLSGANGRRIKGALSPLLRGSPLSKSSISRLVGRLKGFFEEWRGRSLKEEQVVYGYYDAIALRVRVVRKVVSVPVLVALGIRADGTKAILALEMVGSESAEAWKGFVDGLADRGLRRPRLVIIDGNKGLRAAVEARWPGVNVQRCTVHKLRNLERYVPKHGLEEMKTDYHTIIYADSLAGARKAYCRFVDKWSKLAPKVAKSLEEAGEELLTFYRFPRTQWRSLRTTNVIERLHGEFRRRVKTMGGLPNEEAAELLFFGLLYSGQIRMKKISGWREMYMVSEEAVQKVA